MATTGIFKIVSSNNDITAAEVSGSENELNLQNCRNTLLEKFENLANQLSAGWKYHIANTDGIKEAWINFDDFYTEICSFASSDQNLPTIVNSNKTNDTGFESYRYHHHQQQQHHYRTTQECHKLLIEKVDALTSKLSPNWTMAIESINGISLAWKNFLQYFQRICAQDHGKPYNFHHINCFTNICLIKTGGMTINLLEIKQKVGN
ncbi:unnamed protein product [Thelazia callipaeda]|uniref:Uncharacterized protein n=1 Tax=Thelazia callipaeda TaxID=103827 RepID=A0A0N5CYL3_THECL|nr:unnamed protein product [Thelazia callipaeda]